MADIERMRAALVAAREHIWIDRAHLRQLFVGFTSQREQSILNEYDALLAQIDAALADHTPAPSVPKLEAVAQRTLALFKRQKFRADGDGEEAQIMRLATEALGQEAQR